MAALKNQRHELFCQARAKGLTQSQAAVAAGLSPKSAESQGSRLNKDERILLRICELQLENPVKSVKDGVEVEVKVNPASVQVLENAAPFVRAKIADRAYRLTVLQEMLNELRAPEARVTRMGNVASAAYREARECLKQAAIEIGDWEEAHRIVAPAGEDLRHMTPEQLFAEQRVLLEARAKIEALRSGQVLIEGSVEESGAEVEGTVDRS
ncbi:MAG: hypothetical protein ACLGXA_07985 [Acidobacteriota bacterium]